MFFNNYTDCPPTPLFAFSHGLSYTSFEYANLEIRAATTAAPIEVTVEVRNGGQRAAIEIVKPYGSEHVASVARPDRLLLGFTRVPLEPGQIKRVQFNIHPSRLAFYDPHMRFVTEPGTFTFSVGASSADVRAEQTVELSGAVVEYLQREIVATSVAVE